MPAAILRLPILAVFPSFVSLTPLLPSGDTKGSTFQPSDSHCDLEASRSMKVAPRAFCLVIIGKFAVFGVSGVAGFSAFAAIFGATGVGAGAVGVGTFATGASWMGAGGVGVVSGATVGASDAILVWGGVGSGDPATSEVAASGGDAGLSSDPFHRLTDEVPKARAAAAAIPTPILLACFCTKPLGSCSSVSVSAGAAIGGRLEGLTVPGQPWVVALADSGFRAVGLQAGGLLVSTGCMPN